MGRPHAHPGRDAAACAVLLALLVGGCGETPAKLKARIANVACEPGGHRVAVAVRLARVSWPTGLAAFPDGGVAREYEARAEFWLADPVSGACTRLGTFERPTHMRTQFGPWMAGWSGGAPIARVTGYPGAETSAGAMRLHVLRLAPAGAVESLPAVPDDAVLEQRAPVDPRRRARARWVEASAGPETLRVRTERDAALRAAFALDPLTGELRALGAPALAERAR